MAAGKTCDDRRHHCAAHRRRRLDCRAGVRFARSRTTCQPMQTAVVIPAIAEMAGRACSDTISMPVPESAMARHSTPGCRVMPTPSRRIDIALWDLFGRALGTPLHAVLLGGRRCRNSFRSITRLLAWRRRTWRAMAREAFRRSGIRQFQVKLGADSDNEADIARLRLVREAVGPGPIVYGDWNCGANRNWTRSASAGPCGRPSRHHARTALRDAGGLRVRSRPPPGCR
jgi:hypothetical protein